MKRTHRGLNMLLRMRVACACLLYHSDLIRAWTYIYGINDKAVNNYMCIIPPTIRHEKIHTRLTYIMTNKQSSATASVLFSGGATLFSYPTSEQISGVSCWIYLDGSHLLTRQHLSMFFDNYWTFIDDRGFNTGGSCYLDIFTYTPHIHVTHWCFLLFVDRIWIHTYHVCWKCDSVYFISLLEY